MSEDDSLDEDTTSEVCPICADKECQRHLLACFDSSGDEGELDIGLVSGPLLDANEIEEVLRRARLAWVQSAQATGKPEAPQWIMKETGLQNYFDVLGSGGFVLKEYESDEDAVDDLREQTDNEHGEARGGFLWTTIHSCGWLGDQTEEPFDASLPGKPTTYLNWWASNPREVVERFRTKLR